MAKKTILFTILVAVACLVGALTLELLFKNQNLLEKEAKLLSLPEDSSSYQIKAKTDDKWQSNAQGITPRYIKTLKPNIVIVNGDLFISSSTGAELKIVELNKEIVHTRLLTGQLLVDARYTEFPSYLQTNKISAQVGPFARFVLEFDPETKTTEIKVINGYVSVGNHTGNKPTTAMLAPGDHLVHTELDPQKALIKDLTYEQQKSSILGYQKIDEVSYIEDNTALKFSGESHLFFDGLPIINKLIFNPQKRYLKELKQLSQSIDLAREYLNLEDKEAAKTELENFKTQIDKLLTQNSKVLKIPYLHWLRVYTNLEKDSVYIPIQQALIPLGYRIFSESDLDYYWLPAVELSQTDDTAYYQLIDAKIDSLSTKKEARELKKRLEYKIKKLETDNPELQKLLEKISL